MLYGKLKTPARDRRTSSVFCVWVAPWQCCVFWVFCVWAAQCSCAFEVLQGGFEDVLELFVIVFAQMLSSWSPVFGHFGDLEGVWGSFWTHLESDSKKYENRPKKWCQKYSDLGASWGNFRSCLRLKVRSETEPIFATVLGSVWARFWTSCWAKVS